MEVAFSDSVWLPTGTADRGAAINRPHGWSSKTATHSWFSTNRMTALDPDLPRLYSPAAVQSTTICSNQGATGQQSRRIQVYPDNAQKVTITTWLTASRWTYNLTAEILQSGIPAVLETHRQHGNAGSQSAPSRMGLGSLPGEAHRSQRRLPGNEQRQDLQPGTQVPPGTRPESRRNIRQTRLPQPPEPQAVMLHTRRRRDGARRLSHHARTAADGRSHPGGAQRMPTGAGARPLLAHRSLPGAMRH